jgi:hypothetical protein
MTSLHKICLLAVVALMTLTACNRENVDQIVPDDPQFEPVEVDVNTLMGAMKATNSEGMSLGCMTVLYPFDLKTVSEATVSISSEEDFHAAVSPQIADPAVDFVFPLEVKGAGGSRAQMMNNAELGTSFGSCTPTTGWTALATSSAGSIPAFLFDSLCFDLVYPVDLEDQNGTPYTATNQGDFINLLATVDTLYFSLPVTVDTSGVQVTISTQAEFLDLVYTCQGISAPVGGGGFTIQGFCQKLLFPFDVSLTNGTIETVNDQNDYATLVLAGEYLELVYPYSLEDSAGTVTVINDDTALIAVFIDCGLIEITTPTACNTPAHALLFFNANMPSMPCSFQISFPLQVVANNITYTINDLNDYLDVYNLFPSQLDAIDLVYPVSVTPYSSGSVITFNNDGEVCAYIDGC